MKDKEWETTTSSELNEEGFTSITTDDVDLTGHWEINAGAGLVGYTTTFTPPKNAGWYIINEHLHFIFEKKPNWFHRKMTYLLLGWEWVDIK
jgi:hypothetical protein